jgi:hypothetical protein
VRLVCSGDVRMVLRAIERLGPALCEADYAILTGDLTHSGDPPDALRVVDAVRAHYPNVLAVTGNLTSFGEDDPRKWFPDASRADPRIGQAKTSLGGQSLQQSDTAATTAPCASSASVTFTCLFAPLSGSDPYCGKQITRSSQAT